MGGVRVSRLHLQLGRGLNSPILAESKPSHEVLSAEAFEQLYLSHRKVFLKIIYDFVIKRYGRLNENDVLDICADILSRTLEGALKKRNEYDKSKGTFFTWMNPRVISRCRDYLRKSYIGYEIGDHKVIDVGSNDEVDVPDNEDSFFSDRQQYIDWINSGRGDIDITVDDPVDKNLQYRRARRNNYLKDKLETLISIKDIREYKKQNPEYSLPEALELLPYLSDCELDIAISLAKREPREKTAKELGILNKKTLDKIISRMAKKRR